MLGIVLNSYTITERLSAHMDVPYLHHGPRLQPLQQQLHEHGVLWLFGCITYLLLVITIATPVDASDVLASPALEMSRQQWRHG